MKSKKIFAVVTLLMFMMTLLPMAAFGAGPNQDNRSTSTVTYSTTSVEADNESRIKVTINLRDGAYQPVAGFAYLALSREATDYVVYSQDDDLPTSIMSPVIGNTFEIPVDSSGKAQVWIQSGIAGSGIKIGVGLAAPTGTNPSTDIYDYLVGAGDASKSSVKLIENSETTISFIATSVDTITPDQAAFDDPTKIANGGQSYEITFTAKAKGGAPIANETMNFTLNKAGATLNKTSAVTDANGQAKVKVYATVAGTYTVQASIGSKKGEATATFYAGDPTDITLVKGGNGEKTSKDHDYSFTVKLADAAGNKFKVTAPAKSLSDNVMKQNYKVDFEIITKPADSSINKSGFKGEGDEDNQLKVTIPASHIKQAGQYVIRVILDTGKSVDVAFESKKQGDITGLTLEYKVKSIPLGGKTDAPTVKRVDAEGVKVTVPNNSADLIWSVSDVRKMSSVPAEEINAVDGIVYATTNKDYAGELVVTVVDKAENKAATFTINVGVQPVSIEVTPVSVPVGETGVLDLVVKDGNGNQVAFGEGYTFNATYTVISKPANSIVTIENGSSFDKNLRETGLASVKATSNTAGEAVVAMMLQATKDAKDTYFSTQFTVPFEAPAPPKVIRGAQKVTMFIGATGYVSDGVAKVTDVAPFIQEGRTFVAVRPIADAFGAEIGWDEATQTVTLTREDMTVTIVIGSTTITVVKDGVTSTVTADQPAFIKDGRTVLPFRAVGDAFGATVSYDAATQAVSYEQ